jgi:hypothetical protein
MTISGTSSASCADGRPLRHSLVALALLADPVSALLDRGLLVATAGVALAREGSTTRAELGIIRNCEHELRWLRPKLKRAFTVAFETGAIDTASTQRLIDCFELWGD